MKPFEPLAANQHRVTWYENMRVVCVVLFVLAFIQFLLGVFMLRQAETSGGSDLRGIAVLLSSLICMCLALWARWEPLPATLCVALIFTSGILYRAAVMPGFVAMSLAIWWLPFLLIGIALRRSYHCSVVRPRPRDAAVVIAE